VPIDGKPSVTTIDDEDMNDVDEETKDMDVDESTSI
jgi:hypothetical protein